MAQRHEAEDRRDTARQNDRQRQAEPGLNDRLSADVQAVA